MIASLLLYTLAIPAADSVATATTSAVIIHEERPMPDYDGRGAPPGTVGDALLWAPRVVMFPFWLVSEFIFRRPLGALVTVAERDQWPQAILDFFTFGPDRNAGIVPSALFDFGFRPSVGVYMFWNKMIVDQNGGRLYAAYGGNDWYALRLSDRINFDDKNQLAFSFGFEHRPDYRYEGIGSIPPKDFLARYRAQRIEGSVSYDSMIGDAGHFSIFGNARDVDFTLGEGGCCGDPSLEDEIAAGHIAAPPGFGQDYSLWEHGVKVEWDTRKARPEPGNGVRLEMFATQALPLNEKLASPWVTFGGSVGGFWDLNDYNRVLSLAVSVDFQEPIEHDQAVPFTELITVGGAGSLPGFRPGTLLGQSRVFGQFEYNWPIWAFLDGTIHFGVGNVFGERLEGFRWDLLRMSFGIGMRTIGRRDHAFNILVAAGTESFAEGADLTSFRFVIGTTRGF